MRSGKDTPTTTQNWLIDIKDWQNTHRILVLAKSTEIEQRRKYAFAAKQKVKVQCVCLNRFDIRPVRFFSLYSKICRESPSSKRVRATCSIEPSATRLIFRQYGALRVRQVGVRQPKCMWRHLVPHFWQSVGRKCLPLATTLARIDR